MHQSIEEIKKEAVKMKRSGWVVVGLLVVGLAAAFWFVAGRDAEQRSTLGASGAAVQVTQLPPPPGGPEAFGQVSEAERAEMRRRMIERMLDESGLTDNEQAAAKETVKVKQQARATLEGALAKLRRAANKAKPSDKELREALAAYRAALAEYRSKVELADQSLTKKLSLRGQVRCMSLGILDNGLGGTGPGLAGPPGGMPGSGGPGGGRPAR